MWNFKCLIGVLVTATVSTGITKRQIVGLPPEPLPDIGGEGTVDDSNDAILDKNDGGKLSKPGDDRMRTPNDAAQEPNDAAQEPNDAAQESDNGSPDKPDDDTLDKLDDDTPIEPDNDTLDKAGNDTPDKKKGWRYGWYRRLKHRAYKYLKKQKVRPIENVVGNFDKKAHY
ncbi:unnamed protein product [Owenia fusiformis]|uniref:Uncharacterized protein n=1 Tax=Owenia fusiformis TaxID=6347 RepID=A0A8J1TUL8_OWEFU|nr:unnamed protein product [Owenia fusiformis]